MAFWTKKKAPLESPVLAVDALGISARLRAADADALVDLSNKLDGQYHGFRAKVPFRFMSVGPTSVASSGEFGTFRLNDMFVFFATRPHSHAVHRHLVSTSLLYHALLLEGFIPRGGLGYGLILRTKESLLGSGFLDAYEAAERRPDAFRDICAIALSPAFLARMPQSSMTWRLVCFYKGTFFLDPKGLLDPDMGVFDAARIIDLLQKAGVNDQKLDATRAFLHGLEDFEAASDHNSRSWRWVRDRQQR